MRAQSRAARGRSAILAVDAVCTWQSGGFLRRRTCGAGASGQCVYCGEPFCSEHGKHGDDYYEVCLRDRCQSKWHDLSAHREWVARQHHDNVAGYCADEGGDEPPDIPCERCQLRFCQPHVRPTSVRVMELTGGEVTRMQMLCPHCIARRRIWD